jgi:hypothetical protein
MMLFLLSLIARRENEMIRGSPSGLSIIGPAPTTSPRRTKAVQRFVESCMNYDEKFSAKCDGLRPSSTTLMTKN